MKLRLRRKAAAPRQRDIFDPSLDPLGRGLSDYDKGADLFPLLRYSDVTLTPDARALLGQAKEHMAQDANPKLYQAAFDGRVEDVKALIAESVDLDARGFGGKTALMMAAGPVHSSVSRQELSDLLRRRTEIAKLLIDAGAELRLKSTVGDTALAIAEREGHHDIARMLKAAGAR